MAGNDETAGHQGDIRFVRQCLAAAGRALKLLDLGTAGLILLAYSVLALVAVVVADHVLSGGLSGRTRLALRLAYGLGAAVILLRYGIVPLARRLNDLFVARLIEQHHPEFRNSLISVLQLAWRGELAGSIRAALAARAAGDLAVTNVRRSLDTRPARRAALGAAGAVTLLLLYSSLAPKPVMPSIRRALGFELPSPTRSRVIVEEPPEDFETLVGTPVKMIARVDGRRPDSVFVRYSYDAGLTWLDDQQLMLSPPPTVRTLDPLESRRWRGVKPGRDVQQTMHYQFVAGDGRSEIRLLRVRPYPTVSRVSVRCEPPAYTGLSASESEGGDIDAVVGSEVAVRILTSVPADVSPLLTFRKTHRGRVRTDKADEDGTHFTGRFRVETDDEYTIDYRDRSGIANRDSVTYVVRARADQPPRIDLRQPDDGITLSVDESVELACRITDDFGLTEATLEFQNGRDAGRIVLAAVGPTPGQELSIGRSIAMKDLRARPGGRITWWIVAKDNRRSLRGDPAYQTSESERRHITIRGETPRGGAQSSGTNRNSAATRRTGDAEAWSATTGPAPGESEEAYPRRGVSNEESREDASVDERTSSTTRPGDSLREFVEAHRREWDILRERLSQNDALRKGERVVAERSPSPSDDKQSEHHAQPDEDRQPPSAEEQGPDASPVPETQRHERPPGEQQAGREDERSGRPEKDAADQPKGETGADAQSGKEPPEPSASDGRRQKETDRATTDSPSASQPVDGAGTESGNTTDSTSGQPSPDQRTQSSPEDPESPDSREGDRTSADEGNRTSKSDQANPEPGKHDSSAEGKGSQRHSQGQDNGESPSARQPGQDAGQQEGRKGRGDRAKGNSSSGDGAAQGDTPSQGEGKRQGQGDRPSSDGKQGRGEGTSVSEQSPSDRPSATGDRQDSSAQGRHEGGSSNTDGQGRNGRQSASGKSPQPGEGQTASPNSQTGGGARDGPSPDHPATMPATRSAFDPDAATLEQAESGQSGPPTVDRAEKLIDELERQLRAGEADPNLLKDLGWTPEQAQAFAKEFRRLSTASQPLLTDADGARTPEYLRVKPPGDDRFRAARGQDREVKGTRAVDQRTPDEIRRLMEVRRRQVGEDYRELLEAYYKTMGGWRPTSRPADSP